MSALAAIDAPLATLPLDMLRRDGGTQPRDSINADVAKEYADALSEGANLPPVTVFYDGTTYWLADGFHRALAHEQLGLCDIPADVRQGTQRDAVLHSVGANASHGYRRSNADKRRAVLKLLSDPEWAGWSDREIARRCGVGRDLVGSLRPVTVGNASERTYTTKHGTTATMNTTAIGKTGADETAEDNMEATELVKGQPGPAAHVPDGGDFIELCRKGIAMEQSGHTVESAADELGLARAAYRVSRQIVFLADHIELSTADAAVIADAFDLLATTQQYSRAWAIAEPVAVKVWGDAPRWDRLVTLAERRMERFERTFGIVMQSCLTTDEIELPYLTDEQVKQSMKEIGQARKALAVFAARIEESHG